VAILFVVAGHCLYLFEWERTRWQDQLIASLMLNGTVLFVFVAGFLFQYLGHKFEYRRYLKNKLQNVLLPYIIVSLPILMVQAVRHSGTFDPTYRHHWPTVIANIAWSLVTGSHILIPYWFIPMIALFYLLAPALLWIDRDGRFYYFLPVLLAVTVCVHRPTDLDDIWQSCAYFLPVYLYGMWFSRHRDRVMAWHDRRLPALLTLVAGLAWIEVTYFPRAGFLQSAALFSTENGIVDTNAVQKLLLCGILLVLLRRFGKVLDSKLRHLADVSFGIYLLHMFGIYFLHVVVLNGRVAPVVGLWEFWLAVAAVVALCVGGLWVAKQSQGIVYRLSRFCQQFAANSNTPLPRRNVFP
jgi:surface polysaccharide O-acyltransferase-like enzyme